MIFLMILIFILGIWFSRIIFSSWINPFSISAMPLFIFVYLGALMRMTTYPMQGSLLVDVYSLIYLLSIFSGCICYKYFFGKAETKQYFIKSVSTNYLVWVMAFGLLMMSPLFVNLEFSFVGFRSFYHEFRANNVYSVFYYLIGSVLPVIALLAFYDRKYALFALVCCLLVMTGKKQIIFNAVLFIVAYHELVKHRKISNLWMPITLSIASLFALQVLFSAASLTPIQKISGYFDIYINMADILEKIQLGEFNGAITISNSWAFIPRFFYEAKPEIYGTILLHAKYYPSELMMGYTRGIFSPITAPLADFGVWYLIFKSFVQGLISAFLFYMFKKDKSLFWLLLFLSGFNLVYIIIFAPYIVLKKIKNDYSKNITRRKASKQIVRNRAVYR